MGIAFPPNLCSRLTLMARCRSLGRSDLPERGSITQSRPERSLDGRALMPSTLIIVSPEPNPWGGNLRVGRARPWLVSITVIIEMFD